MAGLIALVVVFAPIPLNVAAWWRFTHVKSADVTTGAWQKQIASAGLLANSLAVAIPWGMFLYGFLAIKYGVSLDFMNNLPLNVAIVISLALAAVSALCGAIGPRSIRRLLICAGLLAGGFWFVIPYGFL